MALVAVFALVSAGCGARWTDEQRAQLSAQGSGLGTGAGSAEVAAEGGVADGSTADGATTTTAAAGSAAAAGGGGPTAASGGGGQKPCAAKSTAPGVTDDRITVGSIASLSGPVPGISASAAAATRAYVAYRNSKGGVCGRQIVLREADDGTDNGRYRAVVSDLAPKVFGIAGGFALADIGGVDVIKAQKLPIVTVPSVEAVSALPTVYDINPRYENLKAVIGKYRYLRQQGASKVSMVYLAVDQSRAEANNQKSLMQAAGLKIVQTQELPLSTLSYDSPARGVANSGADYLFFIGPTDGNASMAKSMQNTGYKGLKFAEYFAYAYATEFVEMAGSAAEGATTWMRTRPNEEAGSVPEVAAYVEWMDRVAPGSPRDPFAADAWAGSKAFFDTLEGLPGPITRDAFVAQLAKVKTYDAGGLLGPIRFGQKLSNACQIGMKAVKGKWVRMTPSQGFLC